MSISRTIARALMANRDRVAVRGELSPRTERPRRSRASSRDCAGGASGRSGPGASTVSAACRDSRASSYMGSVGGGVWKTTNAGRTWLPIFDSQPIASIGAIAVAASNTDIVYVGHRRSRHAFRRSRTATACTSRPTPARRGRTSASTTRRQIGKVIIDPRDPNVVFVAALGHVYGAESRIAASSAPRDGGATWQKVLFKSNDVGAIDLAFDPGERADDLRLAVEHPPSAVERLPAVVRSGQRPLQVHRRRRQLAAADRRSARPKASAASASPSRRRIRSRVYAIVDCEGRRPLPIGRRRRDVHEGVRRQPHLGTRLVFSARSWSIPKNADLVYSFEHRRLSIARRRPHVRRAVQGIARRRRLSPAVDPSGRREPDDSRRRSGRGDQRRRPARIIRRGARG